MGHHTSSATSIAKRISSTKLSKSGCHRCSKSNLFWCVCQRWFDLVQVKCRVWRTDQSADQRMRYPIEKREMRKAPVFDILCEKQEGWFEREDLQICCWGPGCRDWPLYSEYPWIHQWSNQRLELFKTTRNGQACSGTVWSSSEL